VSDRLDREGPRKPTEDRAETLSGLTLRWPDADPAVALIYGDLAAAYSRQQQRAQALKAARAALALDGDTPRAYVVKGQLAYDENDLPAALEAWENGLRRNKGNVELSELLSHHRQEHALVQSYGRRASEHFVISFEEREDEEGARFTLEMLEAARKEVGELFSYFPDDKVAVVLYPNQTFRSDVSHVGWSAGQYDGKVRIPSGGAQTQLLTFRTTLYHEYAHALFHRLTGGAHDPAWLNEGLAQRAGNLVNKLGAVGCNMGHISALRALEAGFGRFPTARMARAAYDEAFHATDRLVEQHTLERVRGLLKAMATQRDFEAAFEASLGKSYAVFANEFDGESAAAGH